MASTANSAAKHSHYNEDPSIYKGTTPANYPPMVASRAALYKDQTALQYREQCSHFLLPLNACRRVTPFPWTCEHERHSYEKCLHKLYVFRRKELDLRKATKRYEAEKAAEALKA